MTRLSFPITWIAVAAAAAGPVAFFASRGVAPLFVAAALAALGLTMARRDRPTLAGLGPLWAILLAFWSWAAVSTVWSLETDLALRGVLKLAGNLAFGMILVTTVRRYAADQGGSATLILAIGWGLALLLLFIEPLFGAPVSRLIHGTLPVVELYGYAWLKACASVLCLLAWPLALMAWRRGPGWIGVALPLAALIAALLVEYRSGVLALVAGGLVAGLCLVARRATAALLAVVLVVATFGGYWVAPQLVRNDALAGTPESLQQAATHRLYIWNFAAERIAEHPVRGWGMNASRSIPGGKEPAVHPTRGNLGEQMPLHPHNFALQIWLELGLPGILLGLAFLLGVIHRLSRPDVPKAVAAVGLGQATTMLVIAGISFSLWQSWWLASLWLAAAMTVLAAGRPAGKQASG